MSETPNHEPDIDVTYSGSGPDARDPRLLGEGYSALEDDLRQREESTELRQARQKLKELLDAEAHGSNIQPSSIVDAKQAVLDAEAREREKSENPEQP